MLLLLAVSFRSDQKSLVEIRRFLLEALGRPLAECHLVELAVVALLAGFSEEFLFRGVLEPCLGFGSPLVGIILSNILFGTCHAVTPVYWLIATVLGCYLSLTLRLTPNLNLLVPVVCHSFYDFVAFIVVRNHYLKLQAQDQPKDDDLPVGSDDPSSPDFPISQ